MGDLAQNWLTWLSLAVIAFVIINALVGRSKRNRGQNGDE